MLGYSHDELLGRKLWEIGPFKDIAASQNPFDTAEQGVHPLRGSSAGPRGGLHDRSSSSATSTWSMHEGDPVQHSRHHRPQRRKRASEGERRALVLVAALQRRDSEMTLLNRMNDLLQTCETTGGGLSGHRLDRRRTYSSGSAAVSRCSTRGPVLETVARWGDGTLVEDGFPMEDCWALRTGPASRRHRSARRTFFAATSFAAGHGYRACR